MELKIAASCCLCDDFLISEGWRDAPQCAMSAAEVMTAALTAAAFFSGSHEKSCVFLERHGYLPAMLSKSQFSRRLRGIPESVWRGLMSQPAAPFHESDSLRIYLADSFPVPACRNIRIRRCKTYQDECFRGRVSSRKEYFYGLKAHALMAESGIPVEIFLSPGSYADVNALYDFSFPVHSGSVIYGDRACNACNIEDEIKRSNVDKNSKRKYEAFAEDGIKLIRKRIESAFSVIAQRFPAHIHAVTAQGFELKIFLFVLACGIEKTMMQVTTLVIERCTAAGNSIFYEPDHLVGIGEQYLDRLADHLAVLAGVLERIQEDQQTDGGSPRMKILAFHCEWSRF